jgi:hypothetical protein
MDLFHTPVRYNAMLTAPFKDLLIPLSDPQKQSRSNKRPFALVEPEFADMTRSKKTKPDIDISSLSPSDRQALERVAAILNKPVLELCEGPSANPSSSTCRPVDIPRTNGAETGYGHSRTMSTTQPEDMNNWQYAEHGEFYGHMPFAQLPGFAFAPEVLNQTEIGQLGGGGYTGDSGNLGDLDVSKNGMWSYDGDFGANMHIQTANEPPNDQLSMTPRMAGRPGSSASASSSELSIVEVPQQNKSAEKLSPSSSPRDSSFRWTLSDSSSRKSSSHRQQRRRPFQSQQLREETSNTRKLKACVRCRIQKIRVRISCSADLQTKINPTSV